MKNLMLIVCLCTGAIEAFAATRVENIAIPKKITKAVIVNTKGVTMVHGAKRTDSHIKVTKVKMPKVCEFRQGVKDSTLYISVRNRGFTGAGDCEVNLDITVPANIRLDVKTGSGVTEIDGVNGSIQYANGAGVVKINSTSR